MKGSSIPVYAPADNVTLADLVPDLAKDHAPFYTYRGSLTTPPCYQSVRWIVMKNPAMVTKKNQVFSPKLKTFTLQMPKISVDAKRTSQLECTSQYLWFSFEISR